jgi:hypothetical protein
MLSKYLHLFRDDNAENEKRKILLHTCYVLVFACGKPQFEKFLLNLNFLWGCLGKVLNWLENIVKKVKIFLEHV